MALIKTPIEMVREQLADLAEGYDVDRHGIIRSPGSYEGEHIEVLYWNDCYTSGDGEDIEAFDDGSGSVRFVVSDLEREAFGIEAGFALLSWSSNGFASLEYQGADA